MCGNDYRDASRYRLCIFMMFQWFGSHVLNEPMYSSRLAMISILFSDVSGDNVHPFFHKRPCCGR